MVDSKENCVMTDQYNRIQGAVIKTQHRNYYVYKGVNTIGRNKNAIINLKNLNVSQNHAVIIIVDDTQHFISDLNSSNGTYLVGTKLSPYKLYELVNDVEIKFGDVSVSYSRVSNTDTTIHLQMESIDMTQNMTQNFYEAGTQLLINESSLNQTSLNNKTHRFSSNAVPDKNVHGDTTQAVDYQPTTTLAALRQEMSIHEMPTQVVDLPQELLKPEEEMNIHEMATQVVDLPQDVKKLKDQEINIHEMPTQVVDLPRDFSSLEICQDVNLHEMPTQVVTMPQGRQLSEKSNDSATQLHEDIHKSDHLDQISEKTNNDTESNELFKNASNIGAIDETVIEETVIDESHLEKDEDSNDSIDFLAINKPVANEHTCNKEAKSANDNDSIFSDSQDILKRRKRPVRKLSSSEDFTQPHNNKPIYNSDSDTDIENEKNVPTKMNHQNLPTREADLSGSETEIEDDLPEQFKNKSKILNSDSETDMDEHLSYKEILTQSQIIKPKILNKKRTLLDSDSETDIEDNNQNDVELSQSQSTIKPKILNKKRTLLDSDSETDIEDNKENNVEPKQAHNESNNDSLNDTDCIPPTQDDFADMFVYKNPKISTLNVNSQNESSEETFKLGLTELMADSIENKNEENAIEEDKTNHVQESSNNANGVDECNDQQLKNNEELSKGDEEETISSKVIENKTEDLYMEPTQKNCTDSSKEKGNQEYTHVETLSAEQSKTSVILYTVKETTLTEDDFYLMPTQKLNENKQAATPSTSKKPDTEADDDFYMMPIQKHNQKNNQPEFKTPRKKYNFRKKEVKLDGSLSTIFSKDPDDPYSAPTQKLNEEVDKTEDIYLQPTQKLNEEQKPCDLYLQPTQDLNSAGHTDEDLYMAPTQKINIENNPARNKIKSDLLVQANQHISLKVGTSKSTEKNDEDLYMAATQPINYDATKSGTDLCLRETQDLGLRNKIEDKNENQQDKFSSNLQTIHDTEKDVEDPYSAMTQPINSSPTKSVTDLYLQETQDLGLTKNIESSKNKAENITIRKRNKLEDKNEIQQDRFSSNLQTIHDTENHDEDPYSAMTQPINPNLIDKTVTKTPVNTTTQPINSGSTKSVTDLYLQETQDLGLTKNIESSKNKSEKNITIQEPNKFEDKNENHHDHEDPYSAMTQPINPNLVDKSMTKVPVNKSVIDIYLQETEDIDLIKKLEGNENDINEDPYMMPTQQIIQEDSSFSKDFKTVSSDVEEKMNCGTKRHIPSNMNTSKLNKKRKLTDAETEMSSDSDTFIKKPLPALRKSSKFEAAPSVVTSRGKTEKTVIDDSETLSQIQRFVIETSNVYKKPKVKTLPKKRSTTEAQIEDQSETLSQIEAFIKKPLNTIIEDPQQNINTPSKKQKKEKASDKIEQVDEEFPKPERSTRSRRSKSTSQSTTHVSKEECGVFDKSESDLSTSSNKSEKSFALLEAKSTKTRKSQRVVNPVEVKVTVCKNRRSMATSAVPESSSSGSNRTQSPTVFPSPEKGKRKQKPKIVFTMLDSPLLESLIRQLGGSVVDSVESSTVLVTEQVKRSQKLLTAVGQGKPVCSPEWIRASKKANEFLDPWNYILLDKEAESKWNFSLRASLMRASNMKLLSNYTFQVIVNNAEDVLKGAIKACGGKCVARCPAKNVDENFVVIASPENKSKYLKIRKQHPQVIIVEPEAIFDGVLRQELRLDKHIVV